jgi:hypothetical protein
MAGLDPKLVVIAALVVPVVYIWQKWDFSVIFLAALAYAGYHYLDNHFVSKEDAEKKQAPQLGPQQPFLPQVKTYDINPVTGEPIAKYQAPQYPSQRMR